MYTMYTYTRTMRANVYVLVYRMYVRTYVRTYVCMYVCMYICMHVYDVRTSCKVTHIRDSNMSDRRECQQAPGLHSFQPGLT